MPVSRRDTRAVAGATGSRAGAPPTVGNRVKSALTQVYDTSAGTEVKHCDEIVMRATALPNTSTRDVCRAA